MDFTSPQTLQDLYGNGFTTVNLIDERDKLARLFQDQKLAQEQQDTQTKTLANQFNERTMDERVRRPGLENIGLKHQNVISGVNSRIAAQTESAQLNAKQKELALKATDDQMKEMESRARIWAMDPDPAVQKRGLDTMNMFQSFVLERQKAEKAMELERYRQQQETGRFVEGLQSKEAVVKTLADSRVTAAGNKQVKPPKTAEEAYIRQIQESDLDPADKAQMITDFVNKQIEAKVLAATTGIAPNVDATGKIGVGAKPSAPAVAAPIPGQTPQAKPAVPNGLPPGAKQIGTSQGRPVYQLPDGRKVIAQ